MKKVIAIIFVSILTVNVLCSCSAVNKQPDEDQIKAICELSTLECYYNNVAKSTKEKGKGWQHLLEKEREFWIEYEGVAEIGIDMNQVSMEISKDNVVTISMPEAKLLGISIVNETLTEDSYIISKDGWVNKNKITAEEQKAAINNAQEEMKETVLANKMLFERAEKEAKELIENYINKLGDMSKKTYTIVWEKA